MKILLSTFFLLILMSCEAPQRTRLQSAYDKMTNPYTNEYGSGSAESGSFNPDPNKDSTPVASEYAHCDYSYRYHTIDIGHFAICQSRTDETKFKFKTQMANRNIQVCLIPTYRDAAGGSTYLGKPQCAYTEAGRDYEGRLYKDRSGFSGYNITGVIVLKYGLHEAYFSCMNASLNWPANVCAYGPNTSASCSQLYYTCPSGSATNANCAAQANGHMSQVCEQFKSTYRNSYVDISTR